MDVLIFDTKTGTVAATIAIPVGRDCAPSKQECFQRAWKVAVSSKAVDPTRRDDYRFKWA
jgi:hypothetical protein